jgi:hypothetical protein
MGLKSPARRVLVRLPPPNPLYTSPKRVLVKRKLNPLYTGAKRTPKKRSPWKARGAWK